MAKIMPGTLLIVLQRAKLVLALVMLGLPLVVVAADHPPPELADLVGERLEFRLKWQGISAADATLEVMGGDKGQILFRATARTVGLADFLYPVRSQIDSTVWIDGFRAERYVKTGQEGRGDEQDVEELVFDLDGGQAFLSEDGETREPVEVPADVKDPFSAFYAFRVGEPGPDGVLELTITDGNVVTLYPGGVVIGLDESPFPICTEVQYRHHISREKGVLLKTIQVLVIGRFIVPVIGWIGAHI